MLIGLAHVPFVFLQLHVVWVTCSSSRDVQTGTLPKTSMDRENGAMKDLGSLG